MTKTEVTVLHVAAEVDVVAEKDNEKRYLLNSAKVSCAKVGPGSSDVDVNGNDSLNGVVVEPDGNCVVEEEHEVKSESDSVTITMHQQEVGIEAEKENETRYLVNGANTSSVKVDSDSTDVYVNVNGSDSVNGVVVESGDNCIVEEDHEVKSEYDPVTITMNQQEVDIVAEKENETSYLLNGANVSCLKVGFGSFDVYANGSDSVNGVVVQSVDNFIVEDDHKVKSESDSVTITMHQQKVGIEAEKENETSYLLNGANTSSVKVGSGSTDVYVNVNGRDSVNGVVVESGNNCIVEEDHEVKSESDSVTISMNQLEGEKPVEEKGGYVQEKSGDGDDCLAKQTVQEAAVVIDSRVEKSDSVSESSVVIDSGLKQSDGKVDDSVETDANSIVINSVTTDDDATHIEIKTGSESSESSTTVETDTNFVVGSISFSVDVQSNQYNGNLANSEMVDKSLDVVSGLKLETNVSSDSISLVASNPAERPCGVTDGGIEFGSLDDEAERKAPFNYMIRVPRNNDESLKVKIRLAQTKVDEKSRIRDGIRNDMQSTRVTSKEYGNDFNAAVSQERKARDFHRSKCREIESMQSMMDIEDIDVKMRNMEWTIQHETLPLKDEKKFISDIKQLKQTREKLSSTMSRQDENQQGLDRKERLKSLKKEADQLKANLKNAEAITKAAKRKYYEETENTSSKLQMTSNKKRMRSCKYKDDLNKANELASKGDKVALQNFCINQPMVQVEKFMDLWNNNDEFRKEYVRCNERSTLWRLRTLDGRALGPGEVPPVIPRAVNGRAVVDHTMSGLTLEDRTQELVAAAKAEKVLAEKVVEQKKFMKSAPPESVSTTASNGDKIEEAEEEKPKRTKEEEESDRKAEELRKEEEAAKLKEQRRLEEIAKAKEALERKRRKAEKDEAREANRAAKEAEKKEKKREKRAKKKEKQKAVATAADTGTEDDALSACSTSETLAETSKEIENKEKPIAATTERPQKASKFVKQTKVTSIPPPIRNRGKQKMRPWMRGVGEVAHIFRAIHGANMTKAELTVFHAAAEMDIVAEKENETRYLLNGANASSVKVGSDVYVNVNGKDSDNGVVVKWDGNCIVEEDHEVKSESDSVTITMNQQAVEKLVEEKVGYVEEKSGDGDDCLANGIAKQSVSEGAVVIDSSVEQRDNKVDDDATHKVSVNSISSNPIVSVGDISFVVDVQSNKYNGNLADLEMASKLVGKSLDVFGSFDDEAERETPFNYMIRVPRNDDERLKVMIRLARNKVEEKIRIRRIIHIDMQSTWVTCEEHLNDFSDAVTCFQSFMEEDDVIICSNYILCKQIRNMEWTIQHQTLPLKDEKLSSTMSRQEENQQGLDRKERLKSLKKEADQLRANLINAVAITEVTRRKYYKESEKLSESLYLLKAADDNQEEASGFRFISFPVPTSLLIKHYISAHLNFLMVQVEKFMDLWNNNDVFQKEYVRCNERSTLWRLRTLDGPSLGPGEVPPVIPQAVNGRAVMDHTMSDLTLEGRTQEEMAVEKAVKVLAAKVVEQKKFMKFAPPESVSATASNGDKIEEAEEEKPQRTRRRNQTGRQRN
ncbi:hypothetical protein CXB51_010336 [Gossypium anomalum]|uniref:Uncharacterized protein n=1 Tax=Gossypium anomalum TaxID=47600 RepID=A0A8J5Z6K9_9ROSI|nr:hypothetical protein CXB51_010336 [Gossypium anomalum]